MPALGIPDTTTVALPRDWKNTVHAELNLRGQATDKLLLLLSGRSRRRGCKLSRTLDRKVDC